MFAQAQQSLCHLNASRNYSSALLLGKLDVFRKVSEITLVNQPPQTKKVRAIKRMGKQEKKTNAQQLQIAITLLIPLNCKMKMPSADRHEEGGTKPLLTLVLLTPRSPAEQGAVTAETPLARRTFRQGAGPDSHLLLSTLGRTSPLFKNSTVLLVVQSNNGMVKAGL